jgi:uncharacterized protein YeeX (DUF496 family)
MCKSENSNNTIIGFIETVKEKNTQQIDIEQCKKDIKDIKKTLQLLTNAFSEFTKIEKLKRAITTIETHLEKEGIKFDKK